MYDIQFPNLGIALKNIIDGFKIFGFEIKFYGMIIAIGFLLAYFVIKQEAKRTNQDPETYLDLFLWMVIPTIIGARLYYVLFGSSSFFKENQGFWDTIKGIVNIRSGGLAIYGGVIAGVIVVIVFSRKRKLNTFQIADTCIMGLLIGQILGRWGNFFNREAFGEYTNSLFAMRIPVEYYSNNGSLAYLVKSGTISEKMIENVKLVDGIEWIQVHPTFLYESVWNIMLLLIIFLYRRNKKFEGELALIYFWGYGLGRVWIEGIRTDSLMISGTNIKVSQLIAALCVIVSAVILVWYRYKLKKESDAKVAE